MAYSTSTRRFEGRVAVVTGAGRDIGAATARRLGMEGASVVLHYHSSEGGAQEAADDIRAAGSQAVAVHADLSCADGAAAVMASAAELGPEVHAVVHNSGGLIERRKLPEMDAEFLRHVMDVNFTSLFFLMQAAYPVLAEGGAVVTLSSQAARDGGGPGAGAYAASKGAVHTYTRSLAKELWAKRVRVNAVSPGMIDTGFHDTFTAPEVRKNVAGAALLQREGRADEVAATIAFLLSDDASYLTGVALDINGGLAFSG